LPNTTYHLLTESEPFSEFLGGAISRWTANILRDALHSVVVCASADDTWKVPPESIKQLPGMNLYKRLRRYLSHLPWFLHSWVIRAVFRPLLRGLRSGDIVWIHNRPEFAIALTPSIHRAGGYVVLHMHNSHLVKGSRWLMLRIRVDRLIFISEFLMEEARRKYPALGVSSVLHNGADEAIFYPAAGRQSNATPTVLFVGRLVEEKGVHVLLDAMRLLEQQHVPLLARIVGSSHFGMSKETNYVRGLKTNPPATVRFFAYRSGVALGDLFREADIFCSPSVWEEPFGLVNVEALASGLPVVSTRSGGTGEVFAAGGGILVERGSVVQLADALRQLAEDPLLRARVGQQGYAAFLERFTWSSARTKVREVQKALSA
jgi:spore coat protein SA